MGGSFLLLINTNTFLEKHEMEHSVSWVCPDSSQHWKEKNENPVLYIDDHTERSGSW